MTMGAHSSHNRSPRAEEGSPGLPPPEHEDKDLAEFRENLRRHEEILDRFEKGLPLDGKEPRLPGNYCDADLAIICKDPWTPLDEQLPYPPRLEIYSGWDIQEKGLIPWEKLWGKKGPPPNWDPYELHFARELTPEEQQATQNRLLFFGGPDYYDHEILHCRGIPSIHETRLWAAYFGEPPWPDEEDMPPWPVPLPGPPPRLHTRVGRFLLRGYLRVLVQIHRFPFLLDVLWISLVALAFRLVWWSRFE